MIDTNENKNQLFEERSRNAARIYLGTAFFTLLIGLYYTFVDYRGQTSFSFQQSNIQAFMMTFASLISYFFLRSKQLVASVFLYLGIFTLAFFVSALYFGGMDILLSLFIVLMYVSVSGAVLSRNLAEVTIIASIIISVLLSFIGFFDPLGREYSPPGIGAYAFGLILIIASGTLFYRQFRRYSLRTKLILAFVALSTVGSGLSFAGANLNAKQTLTGNAHQRLFSEAEAAVNEIDAFLKYSTDAVETASAYLDLRAYLLLTPDERSGTQTERQVQNLLYALKNRNPDILSYGLLDLNGAIIVDSRSANVGKSEAGLLHFNATISHGSTYISPVQYLPNEKEGVFFISTPVYSDMGVMIGVVRAKYKASVLQDLLLKEQEDFSSSDTFFVLFDENHIVLAHQRLPELIGKLPSTPTSSELAALRASYLIPAQLKDSEVSFNLPLVEQALNAMNESPFFDADNNALGIPLTGALVPLQSTTWLTVALESQAAFLDPIRRQSQIFFIFAMGAILFSIVAGSMVSSLLAAPILRLQTVAQRFSEGDLSATAIIEADDEVGNLAETFNTLTTRLKQTVLSLEERVQARTNDLELRSQYLEGAAEIGRIATTFVNEDELSRTVVELIRERFDLYYVGLFLADKNDEWAVLRAGTGIAGEIMLSNKHRLKIGEGMIGWTVKYGETRIALDVGTDAVRFENPVLPETRSEGALPLRSRGRVLGAISVQSRQSSAFTLEILTTLQIMADQIAVAFDNAELFAKSEAALQAERRAYGDFTLQSWHDVKKRNTVSAYRVDADGVIKALDESLVEAKQRSIGTRQAVLEGGRAVFIPIKSRGHLIGGVRILKSEDSGIWTKDQLQLVETISEQLSVALESARLFENVQLRAQREAVISDISSKVGASIRMDTILKTTVQELGKALSGADISFEITGPEKGAKLKE